MQAWKVTSCNRWEPSGRRCCERTCPRWGGCGGRGCVDVGEDQEAGLGTIVACRTLLAPHQARYVGPRRRAAGLIDRIGRSDRPGDDDGKSGFGVVLKQPSGVGCGVGVSGRLSVCLRGTVEGVGGRAKCEATAQACTNGATTAPGANLSSFQGTARPRALPISRRSGPMGGIQCPLRPPQPREFRFVLE